jgi:hypothetical protein
MITDRELNEAAARRERAHHLAWIAAAAAILGTLAALSPAPEERLPDAGMRSLEPFAPADPQRFASLSDSVDWDATQLAADPSPQSVAAYER